jgi:hypothetical protein
MPRKHATEGNRTVCRASVGDSGDVSAAARMCSTQQGVVIASCTEYMATCVLRSGNPGESCQRLKGRWVARVPWRTAADLFAQRCIDRRGFSYNSQSAAMRATHNAKAICVSTSAVSAHSEESDTPMRRTPLRIGN